MTIYKVVETVIGLTVLFFYKRAVIVRRKLKHTIIGAQNMRKQVTLSIIVLGQEYKEVKCYDKRKLHIRSPVGGKSGL